MMLIILIVTIIRKNIVQEEYEVGRFRLMILNYINHCQYLSYLSDRQKGSFGRFEKVTVVYLYVIGSMLGNALSFGQTNSDNIVQMFAAGFICSIVVTPFVAIFTFLFSKVQRRHQKREQVKIVPTIETIQVDQEPVQVKVIFDQRVIDFMKEEEAAFESIPVVEDEQIEKPSAMNQMLNRLDDAFDKMAKYGHGVVSRISWQGIVIFLLASTIYFSLVVAFVISAPYCFKILSDLTMSILTGVFVDGYFVAVFILFAYVRNKQFAEGKLSKWRTSKTIIVMGIVVIVVLLCAIITLAPINGTL
ncbi:5 TM domain-containing transmembrane protein, partial [Acrasis kona]